MHAHITVKRYRYFDNESREQFQMRSSNLWSIRKKSREKRGLDGREGGVRQAASLPRWAKTIAEPWTKLNNRVEIAERSVIVLTFHTKKNAKKH